MLSSEANELVVETGSRPLARKAAFTALAIAAALALQACSGSAAPPPASTAAAAGSIAAGGPEWQSLLAAAKKEGKVAVAGPQGEELRRALTETFEKNYSVSVEYLGFGGPEFTPRVEKERTGGLYAWDDFMGGRDSLLGGLGGIGALDPPEPALVLPEVKDVKNWRGGQLPFSDNSTHLGLTVARQAGQYLYVNSNMVKPDELRSWRDLLDPKLKGQIVVGRDPKVSGYGQSTFLFFYLQKDLGPDYIRALGGQNLQMLRNDTLAAQWLGQGKFPICICSDVDTGQLAKAGVPIEVVDPRLLKEGTHVTAAYANIGIANRAPHPNAAKLYLNWVLSRQGGVTFSQAARSPSQRLDVPTDHLQAWQIPQPGWVEADSEEARAAKQRMQPLIQEVFPQQ